MDNPSNPSLMADLWDAVLAGGGFTVLAFVTVVPLMAPWFALVFKDELVNRKSSRERRDEKLRQSLEVIRRVERYARLRQEAVREERESPAQAAIALEVYAEGAIDALCCLSRNVVTVKRIRDHVSEALSAMRHGTVPPA